MGAPARGGSILLCQNAAACRDSESRSIPGQAVLPLALVRGRPAGVGLFETVCLTKEQAAGVAQGPYYFKHPTQETPPKLLKPPEASLASASLHPAFVDD